MSAEPEFKRAMCTRCVVREVNETVQDGQLRKVRPFFSLMHACPEEPPVTGAPGVRLCLDLGY